MSDATTPRAHLLRESNFRWMMGGGLVSGLGDQFTMIALPWLVLSMTGSALTMGLVIALMSIPRALFILVGGALRAMGIFMFIFMGVAPMAAAMTGWLLQIATLSELFVGAGALLALASAMAWLFTPMPAVTDGPGPAAPAANCAA